MMESHCVYWLHLDEHTNPYQEGYIGVTNNIQRRHYQHREKGNLIKKVAEAMLEYGKDVIKLTILKENLSKEEALRLEEEYRPYKNIGWNQNIGGHYLFNKEKHPVVLFHESDPDKEYSFSTITEASEKLGLNRLRISSGYFRANNNYGRDGWHVVNPNTDKKTIKSWKEAIGNSHKGTKKEIKNHSKWRQVQLMHINDPNTIYTFEGFSKALKELNLKRSSLEHKLQRKQRTPNKEGWCIWYTDCQNFSNEEV